MIKKSKIRAVAEFLVLAIVFSTVAYFSYKKIDALLKESLEESVAFQSRTIAFSIERQFKQQLEELKTNAEYIERNKFETDDLIEMLTAENFGKTMGIIQEDGTLIAGSSLNSETVEILKNFLDNGQFIKYRLNVGLIFFVPINIDGQNCILYKCFNDEAFKDEFEVLSYNGKGTVILLNTRTDWTVVADGIKLINTHPDMQPGWDKLGLKLFDENGSLKVDAASTYYKFHDEDYFIYFSRISNNYELENDYGFAISGYAPWQAVAVGIDYIYQVMFVALFFVLLCLIFGLRYVIRTRQAKRFEQEKLLADSANQAKSAFLSNMSHEIRTPINAIMGMNEMVIRETEDKNILEYSENLQNAARTLLGLVNDILDFSKIEAGKMEIIPVEYQLSSVLNDLTTMIETRAEKKGLTFIVEANPQLPSVLYGDEIRIKQVITNILTNAVKYTEKGSVTLKVDFENISSDEISLKVSVIDTGIGIKPEDMKKLFSAFERIEEKRNRSIEGTGLGMNITQQLLSLMQSKLDVSSVYGEGSNFSFQVIQKVISNKPIGDFQESYRKSLSQRQKYQKTFTAPTAKILVVDDTVMNLTVVKGLLKQTKIQIETAENGYECLNLVTKEKYDAIFLDHKMPGLDGIETLQEMKKLPDNLNQETPVISLTANAISGAREEYISAGFNDYLTKPIDSKQLEKLLMDYLPPEKISTTDENSEVEEEIQLPDWLAHICDLNAREGVKHCGGIDLYIDALKVFANSILEASMTIEKYFNAGDWKNYTTKVHALKSSARVIGALELSERARKLEDAGNANRIEEIQNDTSALLELYRSCIEKLSPLIETKTDENDSTKPLIDEDSLAEAFEAMRDATANFDIDSLEFILESLEDYQLPKNELERYKKIKIATSKLDWESISFFLNKQHFD